LPKASRPFLTIILFFKFLTSLDTMAANAPFLIAISAKLSPSNFSPLIPKNKSLFLMSLLLIEMFFYCFMKQSGIAIISARNKFFNLI
jgi:hypothetical protein